MLPGIPFDTVDHMADLSFATHPGAGTDIHPDFVGDDDVAELTARWVDTGPAADRWQANQWNSMAWALAHRDPVTARHALWSLGHPTGDDCDAMTAAAVELAGCVLDDPKRWAALVLAAGAVEVDGAAGVDQVGQLDDVWTATSSVGDPGRLIATLRWRAARHCGDDALIDDVEALAETIGAEWSAPRCGLLVAWGDAELTGPSTFGRLMDAICDDVTVIAAADGFIAAGVAPAAIVDRISNLLTSAPFPIAFYDTFDPQYCLSVIPVEQLPGAVATVEAVVEVAAAGALVAHVVELHHIASGAPLEVGRVRAVAEHWKYSWSASGFRSTVTEIADAHDAEAACQILDAVAEHHRILDDGALRVLAAQLNCSDGTVDTFTGLLGTWDGDIADLAASVGVIHEAPT